MKKKRISLEKLKVLSFITEQNAQMLRGGCPETTYSDQDPCPPPTADPDCRGIGDDGPPEC